MGFDFLIESADKGDRNSIYYVAKAYDTGIGLSKNRYLAKEVSKK